jgi:hypothetical protein
MAKGTSDKSFWILLIFILSGLVIGGLLGEIAGQVDWLWWLSFGQEFGLENPVVLNLSVLTLTFGLMFKINMASIIGMVIAIFIYRFIW